MRDDPRATALGHFKDWSNYLLVTSVAAVGWIASDEWVAASWWTLLSLWSLALSVVFGIVTLALIPLVAEQMRDCDPSFHSVNTTYTLLGAQRHAYIWQACRPQHIFFILGILLYVVAKTEGSWGSAVVGGVGVMVGILLWLRPDVFSEAASKQDA